MMNTRRKWGPVKTAVQFLGAALLVVSCVNAPPSGSIAGERRVTNSTDPNPVSLGTAEWAEEGFFSFTKLKNREATVLYYTLDNLVVLEARRQGATLRQLWDEPARKLFLDSVSKYQNDYGTGNFPEKRAKARRAYGSIRGVIEWQQFPFSRRFKAFPDFNLGYLLKGAEPYFTVTHTEAEDVNYPRDKINSVPLTLYFTQEQAQALAAFFEGAVPASVP
jgi:hypothetical protein